ncbi:DUF1249 domain-containing protein [Alteromonas sp. BL110]|nr:DUF1249 domain-containing protein [Alteromonas sp. BL110]RKM80751.1 DUF1249 domain-containing protein [Alteromonas sp. BL110]
MIQRNQRKYIPHLPSMQALCELNYAYVLKMLPDCDTEDLSYEFSVGVGLAYEIRIVDSARYTSTLSIKQTTKDMPSYLTPSMTVRLYHDARMAEVINSQNTGALEPSYEYPNLKMRQRNEKHMVNIFLAEWLNFCLQHSTNVTSEA